MTYSAEAYRLLEAIVGPDNISDDPAILDSYAFQVLAELVRPDYSRFMPRPVAVVLPSSTEEVQAIVRVCNQHHIKVKPHSTGWYHWAAPVSDDYPTVQVDMRRMNRILEINEKAMYAVVEPYVIWGQLQAELLRRGLNASVTGAGASTSIVASACAYAGTGPYSGWMGTSSDNLLGLEWVTPAGEIIRTGSLGSGNGWFCGEGPGLSLRGICRGALGARGGAGVYTKCAVKLTHWPGPPTLEARGTVPAYRLPVPDRFRVYTIAAPSWDAWATIYYKIYDNEIGYAFHRQFNLAGADLSPAFWLMYSDHTKTLGDIPAIAESPEVKELTEEMRISFQFIMAGRSLADIELQDKILDRILAETGCWKVKRFSEPELAEFTYMYFVRLGHKHINFAWSSGFIGSWTQSGTPDWVKGYVPIAIAGLARDASDGRLVQCGGDALMGAGSGIGGGGLTALEQFVSYDSADRESCAAALRHMYDASNDAKAHGYPPGKEGAYLQLRLTDEEVWEQLSKAPQSIVYRFQNKLKEAFDPNEIGDRCYQTLPVDAKAEPATDAPCARSTPGPQKGGDMGSQII